MEASYQRVVGEHDIGAYALVTGDDNPMHLDEAYAAATMFKGRIAHGMLTAGYLSTIFGTPAKKTLAQTQALFSGLFSGLVSALVS